MYQYVAYPSFVSFRGNNLDTGRPQIIYITNTYVIQLQALYSSGGYRMHA
jgi:hypothetical protein